MGSGKKPFCMLSLSTVLAVLFMVLSCVKTFAGNNAGAAFSLWPDTGQTKCYDNYGEIPCPAKGEPFYGQDAQYQGPQRSYTKLGYGGVELPDSATIADGWIMTRDNVTGLIWEIKTNRDGTKDYTNHHDADNTYTWCDHNPDTNGGNEGVCGDGTDTEDFISALNTASFGGFSDWRLPTIKELSTLVNSNIPYPGPTIDTVYFPNTLPGGYWSSTTSASDMSLAWIAHFFNGSSFSIPKGYDTNSWDSDVGWIRAVRSGQTPLHYFIDNYNGTIIDKRTGLMWQKCTIGQRYNSTTNGCDGSTSTYDWQLALAVCQILVLAGYDDWRLPNRNELQSIVDYSRYNPAINIVYFPNTVSSGFWSSTTLYVSNPEADIDNAWFVAFSDGDVSGGDKAQYGYVRCVRSGQNEVLGDANGDGQINVLDVISVINKILTPNTSTSGDADCNGDGKVNVLDVICVINKILQGS